ncbi:hypothetical protein GCM10020367_34400 [Streptomyces sannanensis]|uniref:dolichyl-phosphate beta-glucosyltransferase n=1 Tax=Streptomyces sannanensis TaxID=285536 RepID=A0ABP6SCV8_9ACTN
MVAVDDRTLTATVDLTVVIPAYDEENRLCPTLDAVRGHLEGRPGSWELIVVDDGSADRTVEIAIRAAAEDPRIRVITNETNRGKGYALRCGVLASRGDRVLITDADLATPVEELERLAAELDESGIDAAIGSRAHPGAMIEVHQGKVREWCGRMANRLIRAVAVPGIRDTQCGFKLFDGDKARAAFGDARLDGWGIDVEVLRFFRRSGWQVAEVPVRWAHQEGSKVRPADYGKVLVELVQLRARTVRRVDVVVCALFLLASELLYKGLWADLGRRYLADSGSDQTQWEWFFAVTAHNVSHLHNPFFTTLQNFPDGVNLMANTAMLGLSVPLTPVTLAFGPTVTWALVLTFGLTATGIAWYWLFVRWAVGNRWAAAVGAALATFAPPMISHGNAHPNFVVLFMIPVIIDRVLRLCTGRRPVRDGVLLGLFTTYQIFIGEEALLLAAVGILLFVVSYALANREAARTAAMPLLKGVGVALAVCLPLVAFPLYWQFFGPQSYKSVLHGDNAGNSPLSFLAFAQRSLFGSEKIADGLAMNRTEQNAFYGWPLVVLAFAITVRLWRRPLVKALAFTTVAAALLSMGPKIRIPLTDIVLPGPWRMLAHQPLFESVVEGRVGMICAPALGALVAMAITGLAATPVPANRVLGLAAVAVALLPIVPTPFPTRDREPVPPFISDGLWRSYVGKGESVVPVPVPDPAYTSALHWQSATGLGFSVPGGYFNGPWGPERIGIYGPPPRHTSSLLRDIGYGQPAPPIGSEWRAQARADLAYWHAGVVVLAPQANDQALYETVKQLLGRDGEWVGGAWIWDLPSPS